MNHHAMAILNGLYMRVLRRIADECRYSNEGNITDLQVRVKLGQPSIDCVLIKCRLRYFARLITRGPDALKAVLGTKCRGTHMPWSCQMLEDMRTLHAHVPAANSLLPEPSLDHADWGDFIKDNPSMWDDCVEALFFSNSALDKRTCSDQCPDVQHKCPHCVDPKPCFKTAKALATHNRVIHGFRSPMRFYASEKGVCPVCKTCFVTRLRLLAHLSDSRRSTCRNTILDADSNFPRLSSKKVMRLDEFDKQARADALRLGHTHPIAVGSAKRADGKVVGYVRK